MTLICFLRDFFLVLKFRYFVVKVLQVVVVSQGKENLDLEHKGICLYGLKLSRIMHKCVSGG